MYKFITEDSVKRICQKYGLIYGTVDRYRGSVPEKNLQEMENFKIDVEDSAYLSSTTSSWGTRFTQYVSYKDYKNNSSLGYDALDGRFQYTHNRFYEYSKAPLEIAAPAKDFDTKGMDILNYKLQDIPDPIVLHPVLYRNVKYYLIVTAWGLEASDELVLNPKHN